MTQKTKLIALYLRILCIVNFIYDLRRRRPQNLTEMHYHNNNSTITTTITSFFPFFWKTATNKQKLFKKSFHLKKERSLWSVSWVKKSFIKNFLSGKSSIENFHQTKKKHNSGIIGHFSSEHEKLQQQKKWKGNVISSIRKSQDVSSLLLFFLQFFYQI